MSVIRSWDGSRLIMRRHDVPLDGTVRGILCFHGRGASGLQFIPGEPGSMVGNESIGNHAKALAQAGWIVSCGSDGGTEPWWNDPSMALIDAEYDALIALGAKAGKIAGYGVSMGGGALLNNAKRNPDRYAALLLHEPATNLPYFHGVATFTAEIDTAYSPPNYPADDFTVNSVGHNPIEDVAVLTDIPRGIFHGTADITAPVQHSRDYVAAAADPKCTLTEVAGATHSTMFGKISVSTTVLWFGQHMGHHS